MKNYNYYIKNLSKNAKDPAYEAYIPALKTRVYGASFLELEKGIKIATTESKHAGEYVHRKSKLAAT